MDINSPKNETVTFLVYWNLKQYVQEELESDFDSKDFASVLENVLTISGTIEKAYASSLRESVRWKWPNSKLDILEKLEEVVQRSNKGQKIAGEAVDSRSRVNLFTLPSGKERDTTGTTRVVITGDRDTLICCAEQLVWLTAVFRAPVYNQVSYSVVSFVRSREENDQYEIRPLPLLKVKKVEESSGACWLPLFKNSIIACGFPIPDRGKHSTQCLGFSYLKGFSTLIYPTAVSDNSTSVQWHLVSSKDEGTKLDPVQALSASLKTHDDKAIGDNVRHSSADDESHRAGPSIDAVTIGFPELGILSAGATSKLIRTKGLRHGAKERDTKGFLGLCESARDWPLILYDEGKDAGSLVPTLSAVLHMVHLWTRDKMDLLAEIPALDSCWDIGEAALTAIKDDPAKILRSELDDDKSAFFKDLVKRYLITLDELLDLQEDAAKEPKPMVKVESSKLYAWDLLDIVTYKRKNRRQLKVSENWTFLCNKIVILVGQGMGEIIRPAEGASVCNAWSPKSPKHQYLTATVKCLEQLASRYGHNSPDPCFKLITNGFWVSSSENLFADCENPIERPLKEGDANA